LSCKLEVLFKSPPPILRLCSVSRLIGIELLGYFKSKNNIDGAGGQQQLINTMAQSNPMWRGAPSAGAFFKVRGALTKILLNMSVLLIKIPKVISSCSPTPLWAPS